MSGFVKKKTTRIAGIITIMVLALIMGIVTAVASTKASTAQASNPLRVAIYVGGGANPDKVMATMRAVQACGFSLYGIELDDIVQGRLTTSNYDVLLLPSGQDDNKTVYATNSTAGLGSTTARTNIKAFAASGGGVVGIESGASFMCSSNLQLYNGTYTRTGSAGKNTLTYTDSNFGSGTQELYRTAGGGYLSLASASSPYGAGSSVATVSGNNVIVKATYGSTSLGHVVLCTLEPELRGDSELDWSIWDNWAMSNTQTNSVGGWSLLGTMINYAATGTASAPTVTTYANQTGPRVAVISTYITTNGGAWPGLLPGIYRAIDYAGDVPLAIRMSDIVGGYLTNYNASTNPTGFRAVIFPGGYCYGYNLTLGTSTTSGGSGKVCTFATNGGGVMGICAGSYYLCNQIVYDGSTSASCPSTRGQARASSATSPPIQMERRPRSTPTTRSSATWAPSIGTTAAVPISRPPLLERHYGVDLRLHRHVQGRFR